jgi:outer membrane lipoprotein-sorting protein
MPDAMTSPPPTASRRLLGRLLAVAATLATVATVAVAEPPDPDAPGLSPDERLAALEARVAAAQEGLMSLEARFVQEKESPLLLEPETSRGRFSFRAPDRARWDFESPEEMVVVARGGEMLTWYRELGRAERVDLGERGAKLVELLSVGGSFDALKRRFDLRVSFPEAEGEPYRLELEPSSARLRRHLRSVTVHLHRELFLPVRVRYEEADGSVTDVRLEELDPGAEVPEGRFDVELPEGVEVREIGLGG